MTWAITNRKLHMRLKHAWLDLDVCGDAHVWPRDSYNQALFSFGSCNFKFR